uniref:CBS domain-containing protein n=1 Tax=Chlamydomonas euryale TaxID=1486919 RepID=A0A7R9W0V8_9CHLO|mmetsp:Transcript_8489/g.25713  ORF Transcript_8489/g.25713 Transcript_8489/m.25713 type:complete len:278 (+) Transcript_8489:871-1704(+)
MQTCLCEVLLSISFCHCAGSDGAFMQCGDGKMSLLDFISRGFLASQCASTQKAKAAHGKTIHRMAIYDKDQRIRAVISQMDVVRFLASRLPQLGPLVERTVTELDLVQTKIHTCPPETSAIVAMGLMQDEDVSSLAVVDHNGKVIGNFSVSELRTVLPGQFGALALPVGEFLALENRTEFVGANRGHEAGAMGSSAGVQFARDHVARKKPHVPGEDVGQELVLCGVASTLGEVLTSLSRHGVHRIYCTDADERPIGIITCSDVLSKLVAIAMSGNHA